MFNPKFSRYNINLYDFIFIKFIDKERDYAEN